MEEILNRLDELIKLLNKVVSVVEPKTNAEILAGWPVSDVVPAPKSEPEPVIKVELSPMHPDYTIIAAAEDPANPDYIKSDTKPIESVGAGFEWVKSNTLCGIIWERTKI